MADPFDEMVEASAGALGIPLEAQWKAEIKTQLQTILSHGVAVTEFSLPDDAEPAPVFKA